MMEPAFGIVLTWDPSPDANVAGYAVHYGTNSGHYQARVDVGSQTSATIQIPTNGATYFFVVTACTADGAESLPSNEVSYVPPGALLLSRPANPQMMQLRFSVEANQHWRLQATEDFRHWETLCGLDALTNGWINLFDLIIPSRPARFYRLVSGPILNNPPASLPNEPGYLPPGTVLLSKTANPMSVKLQFSVEADRHWQLQATEDFRHWETLFELDALADGWFDFFDPVLPSRPGRFYRLVSAPISTNAPTPPPNDPADLSPGTLLLSRTTNSPSIKLRFSVGANRHWQLQATEDFRHWETVCKLDALTNGWVDFFDSIIPSRPARFYRLVSAPISANAPTPPPNATADLPPGTLLLSKPDNPLSIQLRFSVGANRHWQLQATEDFRRWETLCELDALTNGWIDVFDAVLPSRPARFYRLASAPLSP
jgi:hypothetical protein